MKPEAYIDFQDRQIRSVSFSSSFRDTEAVSVIINPGEVQTTFNKQYYDSSSEEMIPMPSYFLSIVDFVNHEKAVGTVMIDTIRKNKTFAAYVDENNRDLEDSIASSTQTIMNAKPATMELYDKLGQELATYYLNKALIDKDGPTTIEKLYASVRKKTLSHIDNDSELTSKIINGDTVINAKIGLNDYFGRVAEAQVDHELSNMHGYSDAKKLASAAIIAPMVSSLELEDVPSRRKVFKSYIADIPHLIDLNDKEATTSILSINC